MRHVLAALVVASLLLAPLALAQGQGRGPSSDEDEDRRRGPPAPLGAFQVEESTRVATGEHVSFRYGEGGIDDFAVAERTLFDIVATSDPDAEDDGDEEDRRGAARSQGPELRVRLENFTFTAHDMPTAASKVKADLIQVLFEEGVVLSHETDERVRFSYGDVTGAIRGEGLSVTGRTVSGDDQVLIFLDKPRGEFDKHHRDIGQAIAKGHVGAEATYNFAQGVLEQNVVSYGNVNMTTVKAEEGNLTVLIEGHGFDGRVIVLNVDGRVLGAQNAEKLEVKLDNVSTRQASNLSDILDPDDDGYQPEHYLVYDPQVNAFQLLVTLPHYSVHTLSVTSPFVLPPPSVVIGIVAGVALLVPAAIMLFRRR